MAMSRELTRYWIRFTPPSSGGHMRFREVGVTAWTIDDALQLLQNNLFRGKDVPEIASLVEGVDVSTLDEKHVLKNMNPPNMRGIWYPRGFQ